MNALIEERANPIPTPGAKSAPGLIDCLSVFEPLIRNARNRVRTEARRLLAQYPTAPFAADAIEECLAANLAEPLLLMANRVLVLELNVARLEGVLSGSTPQERFAHFAERLSDPEIAGRLLDEYPELRRQAALRLDNWAAFSIEFLEHLSEDWHAIEGVLVSNQPGKITAVEMGAGDTHRNGRSVVKATFASGERLVYKPRPVATDIHFQQMLGWLNERGAQPPFRILNCVDRASHGWAEFVTAQACSDGQQVARFYRRQGAYLAILYALEASDFHCENLIAAGEHPMLIDLEALFHPHLDEAGPAAVAGERAITDLCYSVLRVGLLPIRFLDEGSTDTLDLSGLGSADGQWTPSAVPCWEEAGTDNMHLARKRLRVTGTENRPSVAGNAANAADYAAEIAAGFESTYRLMLENRAELSAMAARFSSDEVRVIARGTQVYGTFLSESFHPDLLRDGSARIAFFDRLKQTAEHRPSIRPLMNAECDDLLRGDIPMFTTKPSSRHLWTSTGERIDSYFEMPSEVLVQRRIASLSETDLRRQLWIVRASLATLSSRTAGPPRTGGRVVPASSKAGAEELLTSACAIGDRLEELAVEGKGDITWIGLVAVAENEWRLAPAGLDLYDGIPGIALFLAQLGSVSGSRRYTELARSAIATLRRRIAQDDSLDIIGGFAGWGGMIHTFAAAGRLWGDSELTGHARRLLDRLPPLISKDTALDVIGGAAGLALALRATPGEEAASLARQCGEHLLRTAKSINGGLGWSCGDDAAPTLTGYAHGSAGIGQALEVIAQLTGESRFREAATGAFLYERSLYSAEWRNWPDLREHAGGRCALAWCHGAPGIALSRLCGAEATEAVRAEIEIALATVAEGVTGNHTLCHGELGNADILLTASQVLGDSRWREHAERMVAASLAESRVSGWICGNPLGVESPGLMTGIAGIGYTLLRLAAPERVPSILSLEPGASS